MTTLLDLLKNSVNPPVFANDFQPLSLDPRKYRGKGRPRKSDYAPFVTILKRDGIVRVKPKS